MTWPKRCTLMGCINPALRPHHRPPHLRPPERQNMPVPTCRPARSEGGMTYTILQAELAQGPCPACGQPITYDYAIDATELQTITLEASKTVVDLQVDRTVIGVRIHHDCIPADI